MSSPPEILSDQKIFHRWQPCPFEYVLICHSVHPGYPHDRTQMSHHWLCYTLCHYCHISHAQLLYIPLLIGRAAELSGTRHSRCCEWGRKSGHDIQGTCDLVVCLRAVPRCRVSEIILTRRYLPILPQTNGLVPAALTVSHQRRQCARRFRHAWPHTRDPSRPSSHENGAGFLLRHGYLYRYTKRVVVAWYAVA